MLGSFFRRLGAFFIDSFIISFFISIITFGFEVDNSLIKQTTDLANDYLNEKISVEEYNEKIIDINYQLQKESVWINGISASLYIGYFIIFAYLNKGQTLGKKMLKLRIVGKDGKPAKFVNILIRSLFIYGILSTIYATIFVNFLNANNFFIGESAVYTFEWFSMVIILFMVLYRKDRRGLHDMIAGTSVIKEVR